jgi:hypothetical protein
MQELELRVAAHAEATHVGEASGATSTASWWAHQTKQTRTEAHGKCRLAQALDEEHEPVRAALADGSLLVDQAGIIARAVDALPDDLAPSLAARAERVLLDHAQHHDAKALRILGRRILDIVDPDAADAHEAQALEREEAEARAAASFSMVDDGHGKCHGRFTVPALHGAMLRKALLAIAAPKHQRATGGVAKDRLGQAFLELVETYPADRLPSAGGASATVVVTMTLDSLLGGLAAASLDTGGRISPGEARRLACTARIVPAVLGGKSQVLDLGRERRLHTKAQRIALGLEQGGCTAEGCDWPPGMCHAHHAVPWSRGGGTSVANGRLLCPRHHAVAHRTDGTARFHRRR